MSSLVTFSMASLSKWFLSTVNRKCGSSDFFNEQFWENKLSQRSHLNGFSPVWALWWFFKWLDCLNDPQRLQLQVCVLSCICNSLTCVNGFPQILQLNGFSPMWVLRWLSKWPDYLDDVPHCFQQNGFSPEWVLWCIFKSPMCIKAFSHWSHWNDFSQFCKAKALSHCCHFSFSCSAST